MLCGQDYIQALCPGWRSLLFFYYIHNLVWEGERSIYAYCLFCETQKCKTIATLIERSYGIHCISPEIIQRKWTKGICEEKRHPWLPGYIFLYSKETITETIRIPGIIRRLGDGELKNEDLAFANMLMEHDGVIGTVQLIEVGDRCVIHDPLWQQTEGRVIKIDRGRKRCCVAFTFDQVRRTVWLGYTMINPADKTRENKN